MLEKILGIYNKSYQNEISLHILSEWLKEKVVIPTNSGKNVEKLDHS